MECVTQKSFRDITAVKIEFKNAEFGIQSDLGVSTNLTWGYRKMNGLFSNHNHIKVVVHDFSYRDGKSYVGEGMFSNRRYDLSDL